MELGLVIVALVACSSVSPPYSAVTDLAVRPEPALPSIGPAGSQLQDPTFHSRILRVTDPETRPDRPGEGYNTPASSEANTWNANSTKFYVQDFSGAVIPYTFDPRSLRATRLGDSSSISGGLVLPLRSGPSFSFIHPDQIYGFSLASPLVFSVYRFSASSLTALHDPRTCISSLANSAGDISVSGDDQRLTSPMSDSAAAPDYFYVYDRRSGCRWYNTLTGELGGQWGPIGTINSTARFRVAHARLAKDGTYARIETRECATECESYYIWDIRSLNLLPCSASQPNYCRGEQVAGYAQMINQGELNDAVDLLKRSLIAPEDFTHLIDSPPGPEQHDLGLSLSWNNAESGTLNPVLASTFRKDGGRAQRAWDNEIIAIRTDGEASTVWRFAHTRTTAADSRTVPGGNVSQDGRFYMFNSNWEGTVGTGRSDVFVVELDASQPPSDSTSPLISGVASSSITGGSAGIIWTTDEPADGQVDYGTTSSYGNSTARAASLVTSHHVTLGGLREGTLYHYRVKSRDAGGNPAVSGDFTFRTPAAADKTPPVISAVAASAITFSTATISWNTDEPSDTQVEYGTTTSYGTSTPVSGSLVTSHSATLSGLTADTVYHYRVKSRDAAGNLATSADFTFTTATAPDTTAPVISNLTSSNFISSAATITWTTNEPSNTQVEYGVTASYGNSIALNSSLVTSHSATLSGLTAGMPYHYRVKSRDAAGNLAVSGDLTFTTFPPPLPSGSVAINPGDDIQRGVDSNPTGTSFLLRAGVHRLQTVTPKDGDTFTGESGAVMSGARLLTSFQREGSYWVALGQTQEGVVHGKCLTEFPRCNYPEDLFIDDRPLQHASTLAKVAPGKWHFDYATDKIYMADDPAGHKVETSVLPHAFYGSASNVTIRGLIIEKYATPAQSGAIHAMTDPGPLSQNWVVEKNEIRLNHGGGIRLGSGIQVLSNKIHHNGQIGITGAGSGILVSDNEIAANNYAGFSYGWEAGGTKFSFTQNLVVRNNYVHHNIGPGLWTDGDNYDVLYEYNRTAANRGGGIVHEISFAATIRHNTIENEPTGEGGTSLWYGAGIMVSSSSDVEIYGNTVTNCANGITADQANRGSDPRSGKPYIVRNLNVHDNVISQISGQAAGIVSDTSSISDEIYKSWNNRYTHNTYKLPSLSGRYFQWLNTPRTIEEWKSFGNDIDGIFQIP